MNIYFNDWSCAGKESIGEHTSHIRDFSRLLSTLCDTGICTPVLGSKPSSLTLCDLPLSECYRYHEGKDNPLYGLILSIFNNFTQTALDPAHFFTKEAHPASTLLGNAHYHGCPAISLCFNPIYAADTVEGTKDGKKTAVPNIYRADGLSVLASRLYSRSECRRHCALTDPLWNKAATKTYMDRYAADITAEILAQPDAKIRILTTHGTVIANLNGWVYDSRISAKNSNDGCIRLIFKSSGFNETAYLSIDFEKADVFFELHNKKGRHQGEYKWTGDPSEEADPSGKHNIEV